MIGLLALAQRHQQENGDEHNQQCDENHHALRQRGRFLLRSGIQGRLRGLRPIGFSIVRLRESRYGFRKNGNRKSSRLLIGSVR